MIAKARRSVAFFFNAIEHPLYFEFGVCIEAERRNPSKVEYESLRILRRSPPKKLTPTVNWVRKTHTQAPTHKARRIPGTSFSSLWDTGGIAASDP